MFEESVVYVVGHGRVASDNPITEHFGVFFLAFLVDSKTDLIVEVGGSFMLPETRDFIKCLFIGKAFDVYRPEIAEMVTNRYWASSQKAIIVAYKDALNKYLMEKKRLCT